MNKSVRGMTLIELIIVVAIVGIIAGIGYPSYLDHVKKTRRAEGMGELLELADLVKFAKEDPLPVENQTNLNNVYLFVQKTYPLFFVETMEDIDTGSGEGEPDV